MLFVLKKKKQCRKEHNGYFDAYRMVSGIPTTKVSPGLEVGLGKGWLVVSINAVLKYAVI